MKKFLIILFVFIPFLAVSQAITQINSNYCNKIVAGIWKVEGSDKTKYPFGIKSINTGGDIVKAERICRKTVENNWIRYQKSNKLNSFLDFLADRYCPPSADPRGNINWKRNIKFFVDGAK